MMRKPPFIRTPYNYDTDAVSDLNGLSCPEPTLAQQHSAQECDINYIVERFGVTGQLPPQTGPAPTYGDFTGILDYRDALHAVMAADEAFMALPAKVRERFDNDPALFVDFCSDGNNISEMMELGLIAPLSLPNGNIPSPEGVVSPSPEA